MRQVANAQADVRAESRADVVRRAWAHNTIDERREITWLFVERVVIERARPGALRKVDVSQVRIEGTGWPA